MTPRLFVRRAARADIADAYGWYEACRTGLGREFLRAVRVAFAEIARVPEQYPITVDDIRKLVLRHFPYVIYFVVTTRGMSVIAFMHSRRDPRRWLARR